MDTHIFVVSTGKPPKREADTTNMWDPSDLTPARRLLLQLFALLVHLQGCSARQRWTATARFFQTRLVGLALQDLAEVSQHGRFSACAGEPFAKERAKRNRALRSSALTNPTDLCFCDMRRHGWKERSRNHRQMLHRKVARATTISSISIEKKNRFYDFGLVDFSHRTEIDSGAPSNNSHREDPPEKV